ncbi:hypothetical protein [Streptomyces sp. NPDC046805]|uniref:hypothetical protein n=1 Tax=Streptomyces sp. NPDC046805 TaxID=3155134 RepID=UPI0033DCA87B
MIGAYLAGHDHTDVGTTGSAPRPAIAVDGKALSGSAYRQQRHRHLLSAVTHAPTASNRPTPCFHQRQRMTKDAAALTNCART